MNIDDLLCVGAVDNIMLSSTIGRNKNLIPGEVISAIINGTEALIAEMKQFGVTIHSTGGETADVGDLVRTIIVDSTVTARMKRSEVIDNANIQPGDVIVGLASFGQATYEKEYNGGMGSNGLTSARHDVFNTYLAQKYPESFDASVPSNLVYSGSKKLNDFVEDSPLDAGKLVLSPTRTYAPKGVLSVSFFIGEDSTLPTIWASTLKELEILIIVAAISFGTYSSILWPILKTWYISFHSVLLSD